MASNQQRWPVLWPIYINTIDDDDDDDGGDGDDDDDVDHLPCTVRIGWIPLVEGQIWREIMKTNWREWKKFMRRN